MSGAMMLDIGTASQDQLLDTGFRKNPMKPAKNLVISISGRWPAG